MKEMESLFTVQEEDTVLRQLQHRKENLPEAELVENIENQLVKLAERKNLLSAQHLETVQRQKRHEQEVEAVESRISELDGKLYGGMITSPKEATSLEVEIQHLRERQSELEEKVLELMEEVEPQEREITEIDDETHKAQNELEVAHEALQVVTAELEETLKDAQQRREEAATETEDELLKHYENLRGAFGSSVVVQFDGNNCKGCPSTMPAVEADRLKQIPEGSYSNCQECGRIVAR